MRALSATKDTDIETLYHLFNSRAEAIEFKVTAGSGITGIPLRDLQLKKDLLIAFISHEGKIIIPTGNDVISEGDSIMVVSTNTGFKQISDILK